MPTLASDLRNKLERVVIEARDAAEAGARAALQALAVHERDAYPHLKKQPELLQLRNALRARARQLGGRQDSSGRLAIDHLAAECAYEHWHRMLFARFLAETGLLIEPQENMAISLAEAEELAKEDGVDVWVFASRCAQRMLPQIFRPDDPLLQVTLAREHRVKLEHLLAGLDSSIFKADDSLGWVYQFWQSKKKDEVNASGEKITGDTLPAVTQLFTEHYMVLFLLHNTNGAWHAGKVLAANPALAESATSEDELRRAVALSAVGGYTFDYLRFIKVEDADTSADAARVEAASSRLEGTDTRQDAASTWRPAAGTFDGWPKRAAEIKLLDPCCGSGHFAVAGFEVLVRLRMHEEGLSLADAVDAVLRDNIFGLELDARCTQIAAFNLALAAWKLVGFRKLPQFNIACTGIAPNAKKEDWLAFSGDNTRLLAGMEQLYQLFQKAPVLGSLINPRALGGDLLVAEFHDLQPLLEQALTRETADESVHELAVTARGLAKAAEILAGQFTLVATNVPYLGRGKQDEVLKDYCERVHPEAKADLATCFVKRCLASCSEGGTAALVTPQNWLFLGTYKNLRKRLLQEVQWDCVGRLGPRAFETIGGEVVNVGLLGFTRCLPKEAHTLAGLDASEEPMPTDKAGHLHAGDVTLVGQMGQLANPDGRIILGEKQLGKRLGDYAVSIEGLTTGDMEQFVSKFWERPGLNGGWSPFVQNVDATVHYGGHTDLILWENDSGRLRNSPSAHNFPAEVMNGKRILGKAGIRVTQMHGMACTLYTGEVFGKNAATVVPDDLAHLPAIWCFCTSPEFRDAVREIDRALKVTNATFEKVPFDLGRWQKVAAQKYPQGLPKPHSDDPTQWLFTGHPRGAEQPLQVAVARLLGYRWPRQSGSSFPDCPALGPDGLESHADADGIVCIPSVRGEEPAADRLLSLLTTCGIKPDRDLDDWLRNSFFEEHCKLFHHRPFIWHVWDGRKRDGFHALVNYHKLCGVGVEGVEAASSRLAGTTRQDAASTTATIGRKLLENLTYSYLGDWISRQQDGVKHGEDAAEDRLAAALELQKRLIAVLEGEPPYDLFVRWKPLHLQPIGWDPDINDGVRLNIRPFLASDLPNGRAGAGVLRWRPNIKWEKDRGKEPQRPKADFPWFWGWDGKTLDFLGGKQFTGDRFNDLHYSLAFKRQARARNLKGEKAER